MSYRLITVLAPLALACGFQTASAGSLEARLDQFVVYRNGAVFINDRFANGLPPPSGEGGFSYLTQGGFTEMGGKLFMDSERRGMPVFFDLVNAQTGATIISSADLTRVHHGRVTTNTSQVPTNTQGLKRDHHTFQALALYDLVIPTTGTNNYGIGLVDNFAGSGPTFDRMRLSVLKTPTTGALQIHFWRNDQTTNPDQNFIFGRAPLETGHSQIVLALSRNSITSNLITASYAYVDGANVGMDISNPANLGALTFHTINNTTAEPATIFNRFVHTRPEFRQLARDEDNRFDFARLTTGSSVSISQEVSTGAEPSFLTFNYRFETATGELRVTLGGTTLGFIDAPDVITDDFASASFLVDDPLLNQELTLSLILDGPTGSSILLDSIFFQDLNNGNFATGDLSGWTVAASGSGGAGVLTIVAAAAIPEPPTAALILLMFAVFGTMRRHPWWLRERHIHKPTSGAVAS